MRGDEAGVVVDELEVRHPEHVLLRAPRRDDQALQHEVEVEHRDHLVRGQGLLLTAPGPHAVVGRRDAAGDAVRVAQRGRRALHAGVPARREGPSSTELDVHGELKSNVISTSQRLSNSSLQVRTHVRVSMGVFMLHATATLGRDTGGGQRGALHRLLALAPALRLLRDVLRQGAPTVAAAVADLATVLTSKRSATQFALL